MEAAGIEPGTVRIHLVRSNVANAFVSRGQRLFVTTELLRAAEDPGQVIGVLAHETGHIAGGHLARLDSMLRDASTPVLVTSILAAALGAFSGNAGSAIAAVEAEKSTTANDAPSENSGALTRRSAAAARR